MKTLVLLVLLVTMSVAWAQPPLWAQAQTNPSSQAAARQPRVMPLYEQGWNEGVKEGDHRAGKPGWFVIGLANVPLLWLPWVVEPRRPAKPPIQAEEEFNSGFKNGYRAGWKNAHKTYYIAGTVVSSAAIVAAIVASNN
jgi:hypothetical protein